MREREHSGREELLKKGVRLEAMGPKKSEDACSHCNALCYLSIVWCPTSGKCACLLHAEQLEEPNTLVIKERITMKDLDELVTEVLERAEAPKLWCAKLKSVLESQPHPHLKTLQQLYSEVSSFFILRLYACLKKQTNKPGLALAE